MGSWSNAVEIDYVNPQKLWLTARPQNRVWKNLWNLWKSSAKPRLFPKNQTLSTSKICVRLAAFRPNGPLQRILRKRPQHHEEGCILPQKVENSGIALKWPLIFPMPSEFFCEKLQIPAGYLPLSTGNTELKYFSTGGIPCREKLRSAVSTPPS